MIGEDMYNFLHLFLLYFFYCVFGYILECTYCTIKDDKLGFGVNLFSNEKTLCERFPENYINSQLMTRNKQYESLEY